MAMGEGVLQSSLAGEDCNELEADKKVGTGGESVAGDGRR